MDAFSRSMLPKVSRTFALTIPQLPGRLESSVANAYLLCRIADTIEDEPSLEFEDKRVLHAMLTDAIGCMDSAQRFATAAGEAFSDATPVAERELAARMADVVKVTLALPEEDRRAIGECLRKMSYGMQIYETRQEAGLRDLFDLDRYCYYVAGVVGEMLTELFCGFDPDIAVRRDDMGPLAASFGQGLQMTNILKDVWDDLGEGRCWLPRREFEVRGLDISELTPSYRRDEVNEIVRALCDSTLEHLGNAIEYLLYIPSSQPGIRRFCFWAIGLALLTIERVRKDAYYDDARAVKVSKAQLATVLSAGYAFARSDRALRRLACTWARRASGEVESDWYFRSASERS